MWSLRNLSAPNLFHGSKARYLYELFGWLFANAEDVRFMNYGYAADAGGAALVLQPKDEAERYPAHLYHAVASQVDLTGRDVLDVGSGRGGGASFIHRYLHPRRTVGCDLAQSAVRFCQKVYGGIDGLTYQQADAMALPFQEAEFDAVTNVESSHCYPDRSTFFAEVVRVLKPGGSFLYTDFTKPGRPPADEIARAVAEMAAAGLTVLRQTDVTRNIVLGLDHDNARRVRAVMANFPWGTRFFGLRWAGTQVSWIYKDFSEGKIAYTIYLATKPAD